MWSACLRKAYRRLLLLVLCLLAFLRHGVNLTEAQNWRLSFGMTHSWHVLLQKCHHQEDGNVKIEYTTLY